MEKVFEAINGVFSFIGPLSDFLWEFPTNFDWYSSIPILGNISFAIILLLGSGIFFSFRIGFMQVTHFKKGIRTMTGETCCGNRNFAACIVFPEFSYACRTGKYPGRNRCYCSAWTGGPVLDVDICVFRDGSCIHGGCPCSDFQGEEGR